MKATTRIKAFLLTLLLAPTLNGAALAADIVVNLLAEQVNVTMPDAVSVPMWKFRIDTDPAGSPPPVISALAGDNLTINLTNNLTQEPVSLVINGQLATEAGAMVPVWLDDSSGNRTSATQRVRSFTHEAASGGGAASYAWANLRPGTYLIQSGTHPSVQMPMGLHAVLKVDAAAGQAYGPASAYSGEAVLLYSEVSTDLNNAVVGGTYGTPAYPTALAVKYHPDYFLINGSPFPGSSPIAVGQAGAVNPTLLRFVSACSRERSAVIHGTYATPLATDGNLRTDLGPQYSVDLAPGGTIDLLMTPPASDGFVKISERTLGLANGGMLTYLAFSPAVPPTTFTLNVTKNIAAGGTVVAGPPGGINCGVDCSEIYPENTVVSLSATPAAGYVFTGWSGACIGAAACDVTMTADQAVNADFLATVSGIGAFENGQWYLDASSDGAWGAGDLSATFGFPGAQAVVGDWDGDGLTEIGVYDAGTWYLDLNGNRAWDGAATDRQIVGFGDAGRLPVVGDWDGDGIDEIGTFAAGNWQLDYNGNGVWDGQFAGDLEIISFGTDAMTPVVGNWNGVGGDEVGAYEAGQWYLDLNGNGIWDGAAIDANYTFGTFAMTPVSGDWDNDGITEIGAYENGTWYLDVNGSGAWDAGDVTYAFGTSAMSPVSGIWH